MKSLSALLTGKPRSAKLIAVICGGLLSGCHAAMELTSDLHINMKALKADELSSAISPVAERLLGCEAAGEAIVAKKCLRCGESGCNNNHWKAMWCNENAQWWFQNYQNPRLQVWQVPKLARIYASAYKQWLPSTHVVFHQKGAEDVAAASPNAGSTPRPEVELFEWSSSEYDELWTNSQADGGGYGCLCEKPKEHEALNKFCLANAPKVALNQDVKKPNYFFHGGINGQLDLKRPVWTEVHLKGKPLFWPAGEALDDVIKHNVGDVYLYKLDHKAFEEAVGQFETVPWESFDQFDAVVKQKAYCKTGVHNIPARLREPLGPVLERAKDQVCRSKLCYVRAPKNNRTPKIIIRNGRDPNNPEAVDCHVFINGAAECLEKRMMVHILP